MIFLDDHNKKVILSVRKCGLCLSPVTEVIKIYGSQIFASQFRYLNGG